MKQYITAFIIVGLILGMFSCDKMNGTYSHFIKNGELVYPGVITHTGRNRIEFSWLLQNSVVTKIKVVWRGLGQGSDSIDVSINPDKTDSVQIMVHDIPEGFYTFQLLSFDDQGKQYVNLKKKERVYGDSYQHTIVTREVGSAFLGFDTLRILWKTPVTETAIGTRITYIDTNGIKRQTIVLPDSTETVIPDYDFDANQHKFSYLTLCLPDSTSLDTFYTAEKEGEVEREAIVANNHFYATVFSDDALKPKYIYFLGFPRGQDKEWVWKYDIKGDSVVDGYPTTVADAFDNPYPDRVPVITGSGWMNFSSTTPATQLYLFGNGHYYTFDLKTKKIGPLHDINELALPPWPSLFEHKIESVVYLPRFNANYPTSGAYYEKIPNSGVSSWGYRPAHWINSPNRNIPQYWLDRGLTGKMLFADQQLSYWFSGDEWIIYNNPVVRANGEPRKIAKYFNGL